MTLYEQMQHERKEAMKIRDSTRSSLLGVVMSEAALQDKNPTDDAVIRTVKRTVNTLEEVRATVDDTTLIDRELEILKVYLPETISVEELRVLVGSTVRDLGDIPSKQKMGRVMGAIKKQYGERVDMKAAKTVVQEYL